MYQVLINYHTGNENMEASFLYSSMKKLKMNLRKNISEIWSDDNLDINWDDDSQDVLKYMAESNGIYIDIVDVLTGESVISFSSESDIKEIQNFIYG